MSWFRKNQQKYKKPHMRFGGYNWFVTGYGYTGCGPTAFKAYQDWRWYLRSDHSRMSQAAWWYTYELMVKSIRK